MKEPHSQYTSHDPQKLVVEELTYLDNGPYSLHMDPGEIVGLSGPSGVGKSQLLRALVDLSCWQGHIFYGKDEIRSIPAVQWRRLVGCIPAESAWWYDTVAEHFERGDSLSKNEKQVLSSLGFGLEVLGWRVNKLSSGEKQRLALFRALINHPQVILFDEPTSNLDHNLVARVEQLILTLKRQKRAILIVSHDPDQIKRLADRHYFMTKESLTELSDSAER